MCLICAELASGRLSSLEARRNLGEMIHVIEPEHRLEVLQAIWDREDEDYMNWYDQQRYGDTD